ncbi:MAG TPA: hypothetical protein VI299_04310 [Polyangiales bacterium]
MGSSGSKKVLMCAALALNVAGCAAGAGEGELEQTPEVHEASLEAINGMRTINGLNVRNGLKALNGLSVKNGLKALNGLLTINGLKTFNGLRTFNGLDIDCTGKTPGESCLGEPDGLLDSTTGLMSSVGGINTAAYLIRCALPATETVTVKAFDGSLVSLNGEIGLAPEWSSGQCDNECQEKVSACLMALTNTAGNHVTVELTDDGVLGATHSKDFRYQEAVFFGNIFDSPPKAYFAIGADFQGYNWFGMNIGGFANRLCNVTNLVWGVDQCPYLPVGDANYNMSDPFGSTSKKCTMRNGVATACRDKSYRTWTNPITTYRQTKGAQ